MSKYNFIILLLSTLLFVIQFSLSNCRPHHTQKLIVHGHEWTVPNEDGWEEGMTHICMIKFLKN